MNIIGKLSLDDLERIKQTGVTPKQAVDLLFAEAEERFPNHTIIIQRAALHTGFDIISLGSHQADRNIL